MNKIKLLKFVVFEGFDGSGKSTYSHMLYEYYKNILSESANIAYEAFPGNKPNTFGEYIYI